MAKKTKKTSAPKRARKDRRREERGDGWISALSGIGTLRDKRQRTFFTADRTNWIENIELWRGDDLAGRIVEIVPNEMIRQGWELCVEGDGGDDVASTVKSFLEDLHVDEKMWQALCLERAAGGAGIVMGTGGITELDQPLEIDSVTSLQWLEVFEPMELQAHEWQTDPSKPHFGRPELYRFMPVTRGGGAAGMGIEIHESRVLVFPGIQVSRRQITSQAGWGDAVLTRCRETLRDFQTSWAAAGLLIHDFAQPVWKIKGLSEIIALDRDKEIKSRIEIMELARSVVRAIVIDADAEEFSRQQTPINGLADLMVQFATRLAASADVPVTLLMGMSPAGMNATGESDIRTWYDRVKSQQNRKLKPALDKLIRIAFRALEIEEPDDWYVKFHPLWQPTDKEQAETRFTQAQTDEKYVTMGAISPDEVREQRFGKREVDLTTHVEGPLPEEEKMPPPLPPGAPPPNALPPGEGDQTAPPAAPPAAAAEPQPTRRVPVTAHERNVRYRGDGYDGSPEQLAEIEEERTFLEWAAEMDRQQRGDDYNPSQPRESDGKFGSGGGGGAIKKTPEHEAHAKAARDHAKKAVEHAKTVREALKKNPTDPHLQELAQKADNTSKAARAAARKAEKAPNATEAEKHAAKAKEHAETNAGHAEKASGAAAKPAPPKKDFAQELHEKGMAFHKEQQAKQAAKDAETKAKIQAAEQSKAKQLSPEEKAGIKAAIAAKSEEASKEKLASDSMAKSVAAKQASKDAENLADSGVDEHTAMQAHQSAADAHQAAYEAGVKAGFPNSQTTKGHKSQAEYHEQVVTELGGNQDATGPKDVTIAKLKAERKAFTDKLSPDEKAACLTYSGSAYKTINGNLRAGKGHPITGKLDAAIAKAVVKSDIIVYRGVGGSAAESVLKSLKPGDHFSDKAYLSTSAGGQSAFGGAVEMHITVPKGFHAAPIPSHHPHEREYLLPRGMKFKVTKVESSGYKHHVHVTAVHESEG